MPRPSCADKASGLYHALNRGNLRTEIFHKDEDFDAFKEQKRGAGAKKGNRTFLREE
jgi:hypothetical protein